MARSLFGLIIGLIFVVCLAGASYQAIVAYTDARRNPEPGRLIDIGGFHLKLNCTGSGSPTVVLEAGLGDLLEEWRKVQPEIAKFSRVCSYDRAGYGGSDPGPAPRTSVQISKELQALLKNAGETPPYVLVGHSFGGYNVRVFNGEYPNQVAAMVLVDSTQEDQYRLLPSAWNALGAAMLSRYQTQARWANLYVGLGIARLSLQWRGIHGSYLILQAKYLRARASELECIRVSAEQARSAGNLQEKPLVILTGAKNVDSILGSGLTAADLDAYQRTWVYDLQTRLARLSTRGKQIILPDSGHDVPSDRPDAIVAAVRELCAGLSRR